jgi:hypothetical protein
VVARLVVPDFEGKEFTICEITVDDCLVRITSGGISIRDDGVDYFPPIKLAMDPKLLKDEQLEVIARAVVDEYKLAFKRE